MPLVESILAISSASVNIVRGVHKLSDFLRGRAEIEQVLTKFVNDGFESRIARLRHLCLNGEPTFDSDRFYVLITSTTLNVQTVDGLKAALLPLLAECVSLPNAIYEAGDVQPVYESIMDSALRGMWRKIGSYSTLANEVLLSQSEEVLIQQEKLDAHLDQAESDLHTAISNVGSDVKGLGESMAELTKFAQAIPQQVFDKLTDTQPPSEHIIGDHTYLNPFLLVRAEDFNHNYDKLARLFEASPEWDAIQSRTENVFIEGGRGTGKSMLLRRLTAQATIAAKRLREPNATFDDVDVDYFGVYVKLTRGYYEQFKSIDTINPACRASFSAGIEYRNIRRFRGHPTMANKQSRRS